MISQWKQEYIDENLFVEILGLIALHKDSSFSTITSFNKHTPTTVDKMLSKELKMKEKKVLAKLLELIERICQINGI